MNFATLQRAMKGRSGNALPFSALDYIEDASLKFDWVDTYFVYGPHPYLEVAQEMYDDCSFEEVEVLMDVVDMLNAE